VFNDLRCEVVDLVVDNGGIGWIKTPQHKQTDKNTTT
jgi:hypothetical protein